MGTAELCSSSKAVTDQKRAKLAQGHPSLLVILPLRLLNPLQIAFCSIAIFATALGGAPLHGWHGHTPANTPI
jgi:hypothetical protein